MSLLSLDELRIVFCRDQIQLVRLHSKLTIKGWQYSISEKQNISFEIDSETPWSNALAKLETVLSGFEKKPERASIVLANHFLRYAIIDMDKSLKSSAEQTAFAVHRFGKLFGESASTWDIRLDQEYPGAPYIASAVDKELIVGLRELFLRVNVKLHSIQPGLMKAYNLAHASFENKSAWFVMFEHGNLCISWLSDGHLITIRTVKVGSDWLEKLTEIIDRETFLSELDMATKDIFLMSFDDKKLVIPKAGDWKIYKVNPEIPPGLFEHFDDRFALAMCG